MWVERKGKRISTLDLDGKGFTLLAGAEGGAWLDAAKAASSGLEIDVRSFSVGPKGDLIAPQGQFESAAGISSQGAILVRPDDFVVWRERRRPSHHEMKLQHALRQAVCS